MGVLKDIVSKGNTTEPKAVTPLSEMANSARQKAASTDLGGTLFTIIVK